MIDLALLCNLYADGPTTLGRLRELGCESLEAVEALSTQDLGWALQADDEVCARFRREAGLLRERRGSSKARETRSSATPTTGSAASSTGAPVTDGAPSDDRAGDDGSNAKREGSLLDVLLRAWRRASGRGDDEREPRSTSADAANADAAGPETTRPDASGAVAREAAPAYELDPAPTPAAPAPDPSRSSTTSGANPGANPAPAPAPRAPEPQVELPRPAPPESPSALANSPTAPAPTAPAPTAPAPAAAPIAAGTPLGDVGFEGIEAEYADQLGDLGIVSVEDFLAAQPLDLAGRSTMRYTVLLRMQFTARRELSGSR